MFGDPSPDQQHIGPVTVKDHSQAFVGRFNHCQFSTEDPQKAISDCRNALFLTDPHIDRSIVISEKGERVAGTCEWITHNESYRAWLNGNGDGNGDGECNTRLLWVSGGPGKGKTMLSVFLTEELERHTASLENAELLFFFCSAQDEKRNTANAILRGLIYQIVVKRPQLINHALLYFQTPKRTQQTLSCLATLWIIFSKLVAEVELGTMFCVLDGVDECEESAVRVLLLKLVDLLAGKTGLSSRCTFKLVIVSRDILRLQGCRRIRLDPDNDENVAGDIELFVSARVRNLSMIEGFDNIRSSVQTALLERAGGTFLWVGFVMHELSQKQTCTEILEAIENLPDGLPEIYGRMLSRIPVERRKISSTILRWVTLAVRPLHLQELVAAVGIQAMPEITVEQAARDTIALCGPLLKVQEQEVSLVHQSARDYLLHIECDSDVVLETFRLNLESAHLEIAQKCLNCVTQSSLQQRIIDLDTKLDPRESPLLGYATIHWPQHAKSCSSLAAKLFNPSELFFQKISPLRDYWWGTYYKKMRVYGCEPPPLLHMACIFEIIPWVEAVLAKRSWRPRYPKRVDKKHAEGATALHLASSSGNEALVRLLVDRGADVKVKDNYGETVLYSAAWRGNEAIVRLLVNLGADVKAKDKDGETVLHSAAFEGNKDVVQLLVELGADVKAKDKDGETALHSAALGGNEAVVRLLVLDLGADVNAKDKNGGTALHSAAFEGNKDVVQLLVELGADIKAKDKNGRTALHSAAWRGNEAVIRLLVLDLGADVNAKDKNGGTALHSAAFEGNKDVVQLLVELGADVKAKDKDGGTALHSAAFEGNKDVVQLLVELGADIKVKDKHGITALRLAAALENQAVVQLLVDLGADEGENVET